MNILRAPGTKSVNFGLFKKFSDQGVDEDADGGDIHQRLQSPNYAAPNTTVNSASPGLVSAMQSLEGAGPRTTRFGLRLDF